MNGPAFTIYYADGSTYSGDPWQAPATGVQVIVQPGFMLHGGDGDLRALGYYWWDADQNLWLAGDWMGAVQYMIEPGPRRLLFGQTIPTVRFRKILGRAIAERAG